MFLILLIPLHLRKGHHIFDVLLILQIRVDLRILSHRLADQIADVGISHAVISFGFQIFIIIVGQTLGSILHVMAQIIIQFPVRHIFFQILPFCRLVTVHHHIVGIHFFAVESVIRAVFFHVGNRHGRPICLRNLQLCGPIIIHEAIRIIRIHPQLVRRYVIHKRIAFHVRFQIIGIRSVIVLTVRIHHRHPRPVGQKILCLRGRHLGSCPLKAIILPFQQVLQIIACCHILLRQTDVPIIIRRNVYNLPSVKTSFTLQLPAHDTMPDDIRHSIAENIVKQLRLLVCLLLIHGIHIEAVLRTETFHTDRRSDRHDKHGNHHHGQRCMLYDTQKCPGGMIALFGLFLLSVPSISAAAVSSRSRLLLLLFTFRLPCLLHTFIFCLHVPFFQSFLCRICACCRTFSTVIFCPQIRRPVLFLFSHLQPCLSISLPAVPVCRILSACPVYCFSIL